MIATDNKSILNPNFNRISGETGERKKNNSNNSNQPTNQPTNQNLKEKGNKVFVLFCVGFVSCKRFYFSFIYLGGWGGVV